MPEEKKKKKKKSSYMELLSNKPIKGLSSKEIPLKKIPGVKKPKSIFSR